MKKFYTNLGECPEDYLPPEALYEEQAEAQVDVILD